MEIDKSFWADTIGMYRDKKIDDDIFDKVLEMNDYTNLMVTKRLAFQMGCLWQSMRLLSMDPVGCQGDDTEVFMCRRNRAKEIEVSINKVLGYGGSIGLVPGFLSLQDHVAEYFSGTYKELDKSYLDEMCLHFRSISTEARNFMYISKTISSAEECNESGLTYEQIKALRILFSAADIVSNILEHTNWETEYLDAQYQILNRQLEIVNNSKEQNDRLESINIHMFLMTVVIMGCTIEGFVIAAFPTRNIIIIASVCVLALLIVYVFHSLKILKIYKK